MKVQTPYRCDGCGTDKQPSNNWWMGMTEVKHPPPASVVHLGGFLVCLWKDEIADLDGVKHFCGIECATKAISKWMGEAKQ